MNRALGCLHHGETRRMHARVLRLRIFLSILTLAFLLLGRFLILALALLHLDLCALFPVAGALVMKLVVLGYNLRLADFAVAAAASTVCVLDLDAL